LNRATFLWFLIAFYMASHCTLTEVDIPGAALDPEALKIAQLKFWLRCRGATGLTKLKTKADYVRQ